MFYILEFNAFLCIIIVFLTSAHMDEFYKCKLMVLLNAFSHGSTFNISFFPTIIFGIMSPDANIFNL